MSIDSICDAISNAIDKARAPLVHIPPIFLLCSAISRPGLSAMTTTAKIIRRCGEAGVPVGAAADGSPSIWEPVVYNIVDEIFHAQKFDSLVEATTPIGAVQSLGIGSNSGGPVIVTSFNLTPFPIFGIRR